MEHDLNILSTNAADLSHKAEDLKNKKSIFRVVYLLYKKPIIEKGEIQASRLPNIWVN